MLYELNLALRIVSLTLMALASGILIFAVLRQSGNTESVSAIQGGTASSSDSFYGKNKGKRLEHQLKKWTIIAGTTLAVASVMFYVVVLLTPAA